MYTCILRRVPTVLESYSIISRAPRATSGRGADDVGRRLRKRRDIVGVEHDRLVPASPARAAATRLARIGGLPRGWGRGSCRRRRSGPAASGGLGQILVLGVMVATSSRAMAERGARA